MRIVIDPSKAAPPIISGQSEKPRGKTFYCAVCADAKRQKGDYLRHLLEHLHKATHEITLTKLELESTYGTPVFPDLLCTQEFENLTWVSIDQAETLCKQVESYLKENR